MARKTKAPAVDRRAISHQLRQAIEAEDRTAYALGKAAGVDPGVIQRFLNRERGLTLETVDRLALALGLRLVETGRGRGRPSKLVRPGGGQTPRPSQSKAKVPSLTGSIDLERPRNIGQARLPRSGPRT